MSATKTDESWPIVYLHWLIACLIFFFVTFIVWGAMSAYSNHLWTRQRTTANTYNPSIIAKNSLYSMLAGTEKPTHTEEGFFAKALLPYRNQATKSNNNVQLPAGLINLYFAPGMYPDLPSDTNTDIFGLDSYDSYLTSGTLSQNFLNDLRGLWSGNTALAYRLSHAPTIDYQHQNRVINLGWFWWGVLLFGIIQLSFAIVTLIDWDDKHFTPGWTNMKGNYFPLKVIALLLQPLVLISFIVFRPLNSHWLPFNK